MNIKKIKLINFKRFDEEFQFEFNDNNLITGQNGAGKTAIKDAIIFNLYNRVPEGSLADSSRHITDGKMKCLVEMTFENKIGEHTVRRERTHKQTRITYRDNSQSEEDSQISQETLESIVPSFKNFSAVFNIGWFMTLTDREKRDYILELTPKVNRSHIFEKLGGTAEDISHFNLSFDKLDSTHKDLLAHKLENEKAIELMNIFNKDSIAIEIPKSQFTDMSSELEELREVQKKYIHLDYQQKEYDRVKNSNFETEKDNKDLEKKIASLKIQEIAMPSQDNLNSLIVKKNEYTKQIKLPKETCPTCLQVITNKHRDSIKKINDKNKEELDKIEKLILAEQRSYAKALDIWTKNEEEKKKKLMYQTQFSDPLPLPKKPEEIKETENTKELSELEKKQQQYIEEQNTINLLTKQEEARVRKVENNREKIASLSKENERLRLLINIFSPKGIPAEEMNIKLEPLKKEFQKILPEADITTIEPLKNEMGYKEVFRISVKGKDYSKLSLGEKTRVDVSLSQIINAMLPEKINMFFLDNSEVLDSSVSLPSQSFICKVTNQPLKIN